jgi:hypothetical protein
MRICCELIVQHQYFLLIPFEPTNHLEFIDMAAFSRMFPLARFFPFLSSRHNTNNDENAQQALNKIIAL